MCSSNPTVETEVAAGPKVLAGEIALPTTKLTRNLYRTLALEIPHHMATAYFGGC